MHFYNIKELKKTFFCTWIKSKFTSDILKSLYNLCYVLYGLYGLLSELLHIKDFKEILKVYLSQVLNYGLVGKLCNRKHKELYSIPPSCFMYLTCVWLNLKIQFSLFKQQK